MSGVVVQLQAWLQCDEHVLGPDVFVDQTAPMGMAERRRQVNAKAQKMRQIERLPAIPIENAVERLTAWVGENEDGPSFVTRERQRLGCPGGLKLGCERVFVLKTSQTLWPRRFRGWRNGQKRHWITALPGAVKREFRSIADRFQHILGSGCHWFPVPIRT